MWSPQCLKHNPTLTKSKCLCGNQETVSTLQSLGQRAREENIGQFALRVGTAFVVTLLTVDVLQVDGAPGVSHRRHVDDPRWRRLLDQVQQQIRQQEVT